MLKIGVSENPPAALRYYVNYFLNFVIAHCWCVTLLAGDRVALC